MRIDEARREFQRAGATLADCKLLLEEHFHQDFASSFYPIDIEISDEESRRIIKLLEDDYPVPYIIGYVDVSDVRVFVSEDVLIPEIETEGFLHDYVFRRFDLDHKRVLDLGTGSGFIALAIKRHYPEAIVSASDISPEALRSAEKSASYNHLDIDLIESDFFEDITGEFDLIISNPPYIPEGSPHLKAKFSPPIALFAGEDGLDAYRSIFRDTDEHLSSDGTACFELESPNAEKIVKLFRRYNPGYETEIVKDMNDRDRYLVVRRINRQTLHPSMSSLQ